MVSGSSRLKLLVVLVLGFLCAGAGTTWLLLAGESTSGTDLSAPESTIAAEAPKTARTTGTKQPGAQGALDHTPAAATPDQPMSAPAPVQKSAAAPAADAPSSVVQGTVMKNGIPAQGLEVALSPIDAQTPVPDARSAQQRGGRNGGPGGARTGSDLTSGLDGQGNFKIEKVPSGRYQLDVRRPGAGGRGGRGGRLYRQEIFVAKAQTLTCPVALALGDLTGNTVADEDSQPVLGARVMLFPGQDAQGTDSQGQRGFDGAFTALMEENGKTFHFEDVPAGSYTLVTQVQGRKRATQNVMVALGGTSRVQVRLQKDDANVGRRGPQGNGGQDNGQGANPGGRGPRGNGGQGRPGGGQGRGKGQGGQVPGGQGQGQRPAGGTPSGSGG